MASFQDVTNAHSLVLVDFSAEWCGPCKSLAPILKEVKDELQEQVSIVKIDVDRNQQLATQYRVQGVPTMILYKNGDQVWRHSGLVTKYELLQLLKQYMG